VLNFNHKGTKGTKKKGWMILTAAFLLVPQQELVNGVQTARLCLAIKAKRCVGRALPADTSLSKS